MNIVTPEPKTLVSVDQAFEALRNGKDILVELKDEQGVYAAHAFYPAMLDWGYNLSEITEYIAKGLWYILDEHR